MHVLFATPPLGLSNIKYTIFKPSVVTTAVDLLLFFIKGITVFKVFVWRGISSDIWSEI